MQREINPFLRFLVIALVPAVVSLLVTLLVLRVWDSQQGSQERVILLPTYSGTALIPPRGSGGGEAAPVIEEEIVEEPAAEGDIPLPPADVSATDAPPVTIDPGCENPAHVVEAGQTLVTIATLYGQSLNEVVALNQLLNPDFNPDFISIGQTIVIPECGIPTLTPTLAPSDTPVPTRIVPTPISTTTPAPAGTISITITQVIDPGDITSEGVEIRNGGAPVNLEGWQIRGGSGERFTFPPFSLFSGGTVIVYSGVGENSARAIYWRRTQSVWGSGDTVELYDDDGDLQASFVIP
jgi:LysM repeat protein